MNTSNDILVVSHLGLGDHIIVNGVIRRMYHDNVFDKMHVVVKEEFLNHVAYMYRDLEKMAFLTVPNRCGVGDPEVSAHIRNFEGKVYNCWWYGTEQVEYMEDNIMISLGYDWMEKYRSFKVQRDQELEKKVFDKIIGNEDPYIFVADDIRRGYKIDPFIVSKLDPNTRVVRSCELLEFTPFELLSVIENAEEAHCMHSAFFVLIDCMSLNKLYLHNSYVGKINPIESYGLPMANWLRERNITTV